MTPIEAEDLATRIMRGWPKMSIPPQEWERVIGPCDVGDVSAALFRLLDTDKYPPSIAEFMAAVRSMGARPGTAGAARSDCPDCGGDGMNTRMQLIHGIEYEVQVACRCAAGADAASSLASIRESNASEFERVFVAREGVGPSLPYLRGTQPAVLVPDRGV